MEAKMSFEAFQKRIFQSELGQIWNQDPLLKEDIWALIDLGYSKEECAIRGSKNIYFKRFSLPWLKLLAKLTIKARIRERHSINTVLIDVSILGQLDEFLISKSYTQPTELNDALLYEFVSNGNIEQRQGVLFYALNIWAEENWLKVRFVPRKNIKLTPKVEVIPEEVLHQVYENFDMFPPMLERLFRLQLVLGCRIGEMLRFPQQCLKQEGENWFLLRWIEKRKKWKFFQVHPLVAELVSEQQKFLNNRFGKKSNFDKLFCWLSTGQKCIDNPDATEYQAKQLPTLHINRWLRFFSQAVDLRDKQGNYFQLQSHMFRRTKASIMAYCEAEDEYIAAVLGHASLDMLPHYRKRSLERLEKEANTKGYVDMYGRVSAFKPRKRRYEKLDDLLKVSTPLGECHRPSMLGDCQYRYACLGCGHHRVTQEDKPKIEADITSLEKDLRQAKTAGQERRSTEINRLLELLKARLQGLEELKNLTGDKIDE
jgi:integrase